MSEENKGKSDLSLDAIDMNELAQKTGLDPAAMQYILEAVAKMTGNRGAMMDFNGGMEGKHQKLVNSATNEYNLFVKRAFFGTVSRKSESGAAVIEDSVFLYEFPDGSFGYDDGSLVKSPTEVSFMHKDVRESVATWLKQERKVDAWEEGRRKELDGYNVATLKSISGVTGRASKQQLIDAIVKLDIQKREEESAWKLPFLRRESPLRPAPRNTGRPGKGISIRPMLMP